jgi:hypothetical protein
VQLALNTSIEVDGTSSRSSLFFDGLSDLQAEFIRDRPFPQLFAVISWGCAATKWIAAVLDRHPDISCTHAANRIWNLVGGCERLDGLRYLRVIGTQACTSIAAGDVHGVSRHHIPEIRRALESRFNAVVVVRDPMPRLHSQLALFERFQPHHAWDLDYTDAVVARAGVRLPSRDYRCRFFVHAVNMLNAILEEIEVGKVFRAEDLTYHAQTLGEFVEEITRGKVSPSPDWLRAAIATPKINAHRWHQDLPEFEEWQAEAIRKVVDPRAWDLYEELGYPRPAPGSRGA